MSAGTRRSLQIALFGRVVALLGLVVAIIGALAFWGASAQVGRTYDAALVTAANALHELMAEELQALKEQGLPRRGSSESPLLSQEDRKAFESYGELRAYRVWHRGVLSLASAGGPASDASPPAMPGFREVRQGETTWRLYCLIVPADQLVIEVGEPVKVRRAFVRLIALDLALPLLLLVPATVAILWLTLADGLGVLRALGTEIRERTLHDLSPIDAARWPADLAPLVRSANLFFGRLRTAFEQERQFVDHAAHQLRTPIAALKLKAQLIVREKNEVERERLVRELEQGSDRAGAVVDQLLALARLEAESTAGGTTDLAADVAAVIADLTPVADAHGVSLVLDAAPARVDGDPSVVRQVVSNIIENAVLHSPSGSTVRIDVSVAGSTCKLGVCDEGPGIPHAEREHVFERFYRGAETRHRGTGLGLAIVKEALRVLDGSIELADRPDGRPGLCVTVTLRAAGS